MIFVLYSFLILEVSPITHVVPSNCLVPLETFLSLGWCLQKMIWGQFLWQWSLLLVGVFEKDFSFGQFWLVWQLAALLLTNLTRDWVEKHHRVNSLLILLLPLQLKKPGTSFYISWLSNLDSTSVIKYISSKWKHRFSWRRRGGLLEQYHNLF